MRTPCCLQRIKLRNATGYTGLNGRLILDDMGYAEFEFGVLPKSLKRICVGWTKFHTVEVKPLVKAKDGRILHIMGSDSNIHEYQKFIPNLVKDSIQLKAWSGLPESLGLNHTGCCWEIKTGFSAWWDIDNDVMLLLGNNAVREVNMAIVEFIEKKRSAKATDWLPS